MSGSTGDMGDPHSGLKVNTKMVYICIRLYSIKTCISFQIFGLYSHK